MKFKPTVLLAIFAITMGLLLGTGAAQAQTVIFDSTIPDKAIGITGLNVNGTTYDVDFIYATGAIGIYGQQPGDYDFDNLADAEAAVVAANAALNAANVLFVGSEGTGVNFELYSKFYFVGFEDGPKIRGKVEQVETSLGSRPDATWVQSEDLIIYSDARTWAAFSPASAPEPVDTVTIGGNVVNLEGSGLVLQNNGGDNLSITESGPFTFATPLAPGSTYNVTVQTQPSSPDQECTVARGSGTTPAENVTDIVVACTPFDLPGVDEIIATWSNGIWYRNLDTRTWTQLSTDTTNEDIAAGDFTADGTADVVAIFQLGPASGPLGPGLYYLDGASKAWTRLPDSSPTPSSVTAGDVTGDGRPEVIATWDVFGIWYWNFAAVTPAWTQLSTDFTKGDIAAGDFTADGIADVAAIFDFGPVSNPQGPGLYYLNGSTKTWTLVPDSAPAPFSVTAGDLTGDGRPEIIATWSAGIFGWDVAASDWVELSRDTTQNGIAAGNFIRNDRDDVAAIFQIDPVSTPEGPGLYYLHGGTGETTKVPDSAPAPFNVTAGDVAAD